MKEENEISQTPRIVKSHDIRIDGDYAEWIAELKHRYRSAQVKASVRVNAEKLLFNWELGRDLVQKKAEERWGAGVVEQVSLDLQREFPNTDGFSTRNIWYMKQWYLFYYQEDTKLQRSVAEIVNAKLQRPVAELEDEKLYQVGKEILIPPVREIEDEKMHLLGAEFPAIFAQIPWGQHIQIISRCKSMEEALFYIGQTIDRGLSRPALVNCIKANLYERQGKILNNFTLNNLLSFII